MLDFNGELRTFDGIRHGFRRYIAFYAMTLHAEASNHAGQCFKLTVPASLMLEMLFLT